MSRESPRPTRSRRVGLRGLRPLHPTSGRNTPGLLAAPGRGARRARDRPAVPHPRHPRDAHDGRLRGLLRARPRGHVLDRRLSVPPPFYGVDGARFVPTASTRGPWDPDAQHAGPPAALLGRAIERCEVRDELRVGRITCEILRPVPLEPLTVEARVVRPGRSVELLEASLAGSDGELMRARAWR